MLLLLGLHEARSPQGTLMLFLQMSSKPPSERGKTVAPPFQVLPPLHSCHSHFLWGTGLFLHATLCHCLHQQPYPSLSSSAEAAPAAYHSSSAAWVWTCRLSPNHSLCMKRSPTSREENMGLYLHPCGSWLGTRPLENFFLAKDIK